MANGRLLAQLIRFLSLMFFCIMSVLALNPYDDGCPSIYHYIMHTELRPNLTLCFSKYPFQCSGIWEICVSMVMVPTWLWLPL